MKSVRIWVVNLCYLENLYQKLKNVLLRRIRSELRNHSLGSFFWFVLLYVILNLQRVNVWEGSRTNFKAKILLPVTKHKCSCSELLLKFMQGSLTLEGLNPNKAPSLKTIGFDIYNAHFIHRRKETKKVLQSYVWNIEPSIAKQI